MKVSAVVFAFLILTSLFLGALSLAPLAEAAANVQVIQHSAYYRENKMSFTIIGEVQNFGDQTVRLETITATIYNAKNEVVATLTSNPNTQLYCLLPGRKSPFSMGCMHYDVPAENYRAFDHYNINVEYTPIPTPPLGLKILTVKGELLRVGEVIGDYKVSGTVQYTGKEYTRLIVLLATVYDNSGKILGVSRSNDAYWEDPNNYGYNNTFLPNQIGFSAPMYFGQLKLSRAFSMEEYWLASSIASYELTGEIPGNPMPGWEEYTYYALDTGQAPTPAPTVSPKPALSPVLPDNAVKVDRSTIAPISQIEYVPTGQPHVFEYKDLTLVVETAGAPVILNVTGSEIRQQTVKLSMLLEEPTRLDVTIVNEVAKLEQAKDQQEAMIKQALATIGFYMALEQHSSPNVKATLGLHIDPSELNEELGSSVDVSRLSWFYWDTAKQSWFSVSSHLDQNSYLVCETDHFSIWTVGELQSGSYSVLGVPLEYFLVIAVIVIALLLVAIIVKKQKRNPGS